MTPPRDTTTIAGGTSTASIIIHSEASSNVSSEQLRTDSLMEHKYVATEQASEDLRFIQDTCNSTSTVPQPTKLTAPSSGTKLETRATRPKTRSRVTRSVKSLDGQLPETQSDIEKVSSPSCLKEEKLAIDLFAFLLSMVDEQGYKRALLRDANAILEGFVFPMSFPWAHNIVPVVKNIPRDIDEMLGIQSLDDADIEVCMLANHNFDLAHKEIEGRSDSSEFRRLRKSAVARRADNAGVIELVSVSPHTKGLAQTTFSEMAAPNLNLNDYDDPDAKTRGELSLRVFETVQEVKRQKLLCGGSRRKTIHVSVKVGCSSSRPSLFGASTERAGFPLLLPAFVVDPLSSQSQSKKTIICRNGRNELVWSEKNSSSNSSRGVTFASRLTKEKDESGMQKRPKEVMVGIRVNGRLLRSHDKASLSVSQLGASLVQAANSGKRKKSPPDQVPLIHSLDVVDRALDDVPNSSGKLRRKPQCTMDLQELMHNMMANDGRKRQVDSFSWTPRSILDRKSPMIKVPRIDCLPSEDGLIHVICSAPGALSPTCAHALLNKAARKEGLRCTVCFLEKSISGDDVLDCARCGVLVHASCCNVQLKDVRTPFTCNLCSSESVVEKGNTTTSTNGDTLLAQTLSVTTDSLSAAEPSHPVCACCPHSGGAMSRVDINGQLTWVHDVCTIWGDHGVARSEVCSLCGWSSTNGRGLVKCFASGCSVHVHPLCALLMSKYDEAKDGDRQQDSRESSKAGECSGSRSSSWTSTSSSRGKLGPKRDEPETSQQKLLEKDRYLCRQFTLSYSKCFFADPSPVTSSAKRQASAATAHVTLPVCFCGIHNPKRSRGLYGLYPAGDYVDETVMRIPRTIREI